MGLTIVGGIYVERCVFPADDVIFGSGGRAAATLGSLDDEVSLVSYVGDDASSAIRHEATHIWKTEIDEYAIPNTVSFEYYHGLSTPIIRPAELPILGAELIEVSADNVLQFGMLEKDAIVRGGRVVFDPQNPQAPHLYSAFGSTAQHLAYVLNSQEVCRLAEAIDPILAAQKLLVKDDAELVVVKSGARGATVVTKNDVTVIPAFETPHTWPIGSGDVFAAVFAHYWASQESCPLVAARNASKAAAMYCDTREVPVDVNIITADPFRYDEVVVRRNPSDLSIYLAGPFFTMGQLWAVNEARQALRGAGFNVFSPFHDVGLGDADIVVPKDIAAIEGADLIFALCDGLDSGTLFEVGYAVKKGIPVVAFAENTSDEAMKMLIGTGCRVCNDFASSIYQAQWSALR